MGPQEDYIETVVTCEGDYHDPKLQDHLQLFQEQLESLLLEDGKKQLILKKVEPWNSVRVTFNIPRQAALRLKQLAEQGSASLRQIGVLGVQIQGDQLVSLTVATPNNQRAELIINTQDGPSQSETSGAPSAFTGVAREAGLPSSSEEQGSPGASMEVTRKNIEEYLRQGTLFNPVSTPLYGAGPSGIGSKGDTFKTQACSVASFPPNNFANNEIAGPSGLPSFTPRSAFSVGARGRCGAFTPTVPGGGRLQGQAGPRISSADSIAQQRQQLQQHLTQQQLQPSNGTALPQTAALSYNIMDLPPPPPYPHENVTGKPNNVGHKRKKVTASSPLLVNLLQTEPMSGASSVTDTPGTDGKPKKKRRRRKDKQQVSASGNSDGQLHASSIQNNMRDVSNSALPKTMPSEEDISALLHRCTSPISLPSSRHNMGFSAVPAASDQYRDRHTPTASAALASLAQNQRATIESEQYNGDKIVNPYTGHMEPRDSASDLSPLREQHKSPSISLSQDARKEIELSEPNLSTKLSILAAKTESRTGSTESVILGLHSVHPGTTVPSSSREEQLREFSSSSSAPFSSRSLSMTRDALIAKHPCVTHARAAPTLSPLPVNAAAHVYAQHSLDPSQLLSRAPSVSSHRPSQPVLTDTVTRNGPVSGLSSSAPQTVSSGKLASQESVLPGPEGVPDREISPVFNRMVHRPESCQHKNVHTMSGVNDATMGVNVKMGDVTRDHRISEVRGHKQVTVTNSQVAVQKARMSADILQRVSLATSSVHPHHDSQKLLNSSSSSAILGAAQHFSVECTLNATTNSPTGSKLLSDGDDNSSHSPVSQTDGIAGPSSLLDSNSTKVDHHDSGVGSSSERSDDTTPSEAGDGEFPTSVTTTSPSATDNNSGKSALGVRKAIANFEKAPSGTESHSMTVGYVQIAEDATNLYNKESMKRLVDTSLMMGDKSVGQDSQQHLSKLMKSPGGHLTVAAQKAIQMPLSLSTPVSTTDIPLQHQRPYQKNIALVDCQIPGVPQNGPVSLPPDTRLQLPLAVRQHSSSGSALRHPLESTIIQSEGHLGFYHQTNLIHHSQSSPGLVPNSLEQYRPPACVLNVMALPNPSIISSSQDVHHAHKTGLQNGGHRLAHFPPRSPSLVGVHSGVFPGSVSSQSLGKGISHALTTTSPSTHISSYNPNHMHNANTAQSGSQSPSPRTVNMVSSVGCSYSVGDVGSFSQSVHRTQQNKDQRNPGHEHGVRLGTIQKTQGLHVGVSGHLIQDLKTPRPHLHNHLSNGPKSWSPAALAVQGHLVSSPSAIKPPLHSFPVHGASQQAVSTQDPSSDGFQKPNVTAYDAMHMRFPREKIMPSIPSLMSSAPVAFEAAASQSVASELPRSLNNIARNQPVSSIQPDILSSSLPGMGSLETHAKDGGSFLTTEDILEEGSLHQPVKRASPHQSASSQPSFSGLDLGSVASDVVETESVGDMDLPEVALSNSDEVLFDPDENLALLIGPDELDTGSRHSTASGNGGLSTEGRAGSNITSMYTKRSSPINVNMLNHMYAAGLPQPRRLTESVQRLVKPLPNPENSLLPGRVCKSPSSSARHSSNGSTSPARASQGGSRSPGFKSSVGSSSRNLPVEKLSSNFTSVRSGGCGGGHNNAHLDMTQAVVSGADVSSINSSLVLATSQPLATSSICHTNSSTESDSQPSNFVTISAEMTPALSEEIISSQSSRSTAAPHDTTSFVAVPSHPAGDSVNPSHNSFPDGMQQAFLNHSTSNLLSPTSVPGSDSVLPKSHPSMHMPVPALVPPESSSQAVPSVNLVSNCLFTSSPCIVSGVSGVDSRVPAVRLPSLSQSHLIHLNTHSSAISVCNISQRMDTALATVRHHTSPMLSSSSSASPLSSSSQSQTAVQATSIVLQQQHSSLPAMTLPSVTVTVSAVTAMPSDLSTNMTAIAHPDFTSSVNPGPVPMSAISSTASASVIASTMTESIVPNPVSQHGLISTASSFVSLISSVAQMGDDCTSLDNRIAPGRMGVWLGHGAQQTGCQDIDSIATVSHLDSSTMLTNSNRTPSLSATTTAGSQSDKTSSLATVGVDDLQMMTPKDTSLTSSDFILSDSQTESAHKPFIIEEMRSRTEEELCGSAPSHALAKVNSAQDCASTIQNGSAENLLSKPPLLHPAPPLTLPTIISSATPPPPPLTPVLPQDSVRKDSVLYPHLSPSANKNEDLVELSIAAGLKDTTITCLTADSNVCGDEDSKSQSIGSSGGSSKNHSEAKNKDSTSGAVSNHGNQELKLYGEEPDSFDLLVEDNILKEQKMHHKRRASHNELDSSESAPKMICTDKLPVKVTNEESRSDTEATSLHSKPTSHTEERQNNLIGQCEKDIVPRQPEDICGKKEVEKSEQTAGEKTGQKSATHHHEKNILEATPEEVAKKMAAVTSGNKRKVYYTYVLEKPGQSYFDTPVITGRTRSQGSKGAQEGTAAAPGPVAASLVSSVSQHVFSQPAASSKEERMEGAGVGVKRSTRSLRTKDGGESSQNRRKRSKEHR